MTEQDLERADKAAGAAMVGAAVLSMFAMAHHPTGADAGPIIGIVHGTMIAMIAAFGFGFAHFAIRRGLMRPAVLAGLILYGLSLFGSLGAATINGFVLSDLATRAQPLGADALVLGVAIGQTLARLGIFAACAAYMLRSVDFLTRKGGGAKAIGAAGLLLGAVPGALLAAGLIGVDVDAAFLIYGGQAAWAAVVGVHLFGGGLARD